MYMSFLFTKFIGNRASKVNKADYMKIIDRLAVGQDRFILIVSVQGIYYLISATSKEIRVLKQLDDFREIPPEPNHPMPFSESFKTVLGNMMGRKK